MPLSPGELQLLRPRLRSLKNREESLRNLVGNHRLNLDEVFTPDFRQQAGLGSLEIKEFLKESGIDSEEANSVGSLGEIERSRLNQYVAKQTSYSSWSDMLADAVGEWARRRIESDLNAKASYTINRSPLRISGIQSSHTSDSTHSIRDPTESQLFQNGVGFEIEEHIIVTSLVQLPEWVRDWAIRRRLSIHLSEWKTTDLLELKDVWDKTYKNYPRFYPKNLAKNPSDDITQAFGNAVWYFDLRFFDQELDRLSLPLFELLDGVSQRPNVTDDDGLWTEDDLWLFAKTAALEIAIATTATVIIGGVAVVSAPIAITVTGCLIVYGLTNSAAERFDKGQTSIQIVGGSIADVSGVNNVWSLIADQDIATGDKLDLSRDERTQRFASFATVFVSPATPKLTRLGGQIGKRVEPVVRLASSKIVEYNARQFRRILSGAADLRAFVDPNERIFVATLAEFAKELSRRTLGTAYSGPGAVFEAPGALMAAIQKVRKGGKVDAEDVRKIGMELDSGDINQHETETAMRTIEYLAENAVADEEILMNMASQYIIKNTDELTRKKHTGGDSESAIVGKEVHRREASLRRDSGEFDTVEEMLLDDGGIAIEVPIGGHEIPNNSYGKIGRKTVRPDAIDRENRRVIDEKPDDGSRYTAQMSEYIAAYRIKYKELPKEVVIRRYNSNTKLIIREDRYSPADYGFD